MKQTIKTGAMVLGVLLIVGCGDGLHQPLNEEVKGGEVLVNFSAAAMKSTLVEDFQILKKFLPFALRKWYLKVKRIGEE